MKKRFAHSIPVLAIGAVTLIIFPLIRCGRYRDNPLQRPIELAAGFGEIRKDHFHMGADLRTNGREGLPVYTVKEGYISHISIQSNGYGKAVWVTHPDGTTTLYAHLSRFNGAAGKWITALQYKSQCWQQNLDAPAGSFPVKKGQCIGYSGNTGTSEGPHLHFEVRNTATGKSLNPLLDVLHVTDTIKPIIKAVYWYNRRNSIYEDSARPVSKSLTRCNTPLIGIGISASDQYAAGRFTTGIDKAWVYKDDVLQYSFSVQQLSAENSRYVNACIDYNKTLHSKRPVQLLFSLPGNRLPYTRQSTSGGTIDLSDRWQHEIKVVVSDLVGHTTEKKWRMQYDGSASQSNASPAERLLYPSRTYLVKSEHAMLQIPENTFYDAVPLQLIENKSKLTNAVSPAVIMKMPCAPVHNSFTACIATTLPQGHTLRQRTVMVLSGKKENMALKGNWKQNNMLGQFNQTGTIQLVADTIAPVISNPIVEEEKLQFTCTDNLGAIASFTATADGHWLAFDQKGNCFTYKKDDHFPEDARSLTVTITDIAGNTTVKKYRLQTR
ncbi:hypothetical protein HNQ91_002925 [Filimonas zeae]|uniref:Peptidase M23 n=1 Tax=Filimonas zeae TaxID=1737353 RepID=A0A917IYE8_9BACT|nr:M23 family metallopeptidase [Filimonas zeae]MDR6339860.1 hypothetical protein [Filimonas zeae]GGH70005.1 peptidase M23 [Filimonas zeae]